MQMEIFCTLKPELVLLYSQIFQGNLKGIEL